MSATSLSFRARLIVAAFLLAVSSAPAGDNAMGLKRSAQRPGIEFDSRHPVGQNIPPRLNANTVDVTVGPALSFSPDSVTILVGDTVRWTWAAFNHTVTSGDPCVPDLQYCSPSDTNCSMANTSNPNDVYSHTFAQAGTFTYFCRIHCSLGMVGTVEVIAPALTSVTRGANGHFVITGISLPDSTMTVRSTPGLLTAFGNPQMVSTDAGGAFQYDDASAAGASRGFYQVTF